MLVPFPLITIVWLLFNNSVQASPIVFDSGTEAFANIAEVKNGQLKKEIKITGSDALLVHFKGKLHEQETLRIYDIWGEKTGRLQQVFTGKELDHAKPLIVEGDDLLITINMDDMTAFRPGVNIIVEPYKQPEITQVEGFKTTFAGGQYPLVLRRTDYLSIPNSDYLQINITGQLHAAETLRIYTMQGKQVGRKILEKTGEFTSIAPLISKADSLKITLNSDNKTDQRPGIYIDIKPYSANQRLDSLREQLAAELAVLANYKTTGLLALLEDEITQLNSLEEKLQKTRLHKGNPLLKELSDSFQKLSLDYRDIAERQKELLERGKISLNRLIQDKDKLADYLDSSQAEQNQLQKTLKQLARAQQNSKTERQLQRLEADFKAKKSRYNRLQVQTGMWKDAQTIYDNLEQQLENYLQNLQDFKFMLEQQSEIYQNHAKILLRDMSLLDTNMSNLTALSKQLSKLENTWKSIQATQTQLLAISL